MRNIIAAILVLIACAGLFWAAAAGASDPVIFEAQKKLEELGYDPGKPDGIKGRKTVTAIKHFQEDNGLPPTGRLDALTKTRLNDQRAPSQFSLNEAVRLNDIVLVKALIEGGSDVNAEDKLGETPLHDAVVRGYEEISILLIEHGADVNARDVRGLSPVHAAAWRGNLDMVALLISSGADINARDHDGVTPLHAAALAGRKETVALLIEKGAAVNAKNNINMTPLHAAALSGDRETVAFLVDNGASVSARTKDGLTPLQKASQNNHAEVVELLQKSQPQEQ
jgi:ankyrin repeat protein